VIPNISFHFFLFANFRLASLLTLRYLVAITSISYRQFHPEIGVEVSLYTFLFNKLAESYCANGVTYLSISTPVTGMGETIIFAWQRYTHSPTPTEKKGC
jgi:hypothetical protein